MISVGIIEDNIFLLKSFRDYINSTEGLEVLFSYTSMEDMKDSTNSRKNKQPDIILLDIVLPGQSGIEGIPVLKSKFPDTKIIILTGHNDQELIMNSIKVGAVGYALKSAQLSTLVDIIRQVSKLGAYIDQTLVEKVVHSLQQKNNNSMLDALTFREKEIVSLVEKGQSYKQMSDQLFVTTYTINYHLKNIYKKLNIHSKSELLSRLMEERRI
ncbi:MAG: response regulator transcription factor [Chitinophagaceae bacterium]|nr:response regulator transcription factor [Chitinophagaceae bacterium]